MALRGTIFCRASSQIASAIVRCFDTAPSSTVLAARIDQQKVGEATADAFGQIIGVTGLTEQHRWRCDAVVVGHDLGAGAQQRQTAAGLQQLETEQDIPGPFRYGGRKDLAAEAHVRNNAATALGHAVDLAFLDIMAGQHEGFGENLRSQQDPLPPYPDQQNIGDSVTHQRILGLS